MDNSIKDELARIVAKDRERFTRQEAIDQQLRDEAARGFQEFVSARDNVITPAMKDFGEQLAGSGWSYAVKPFGAAERQKPAITIAFNRGAQPQNDLEKYPRISIVYDATTRKAYLWASTIGPGDGGGIAGARGGTRPVADFSANVVQGELLAFFRELVK